MNQFESIQLNKGVAIFIPQRKKLYPKQARHFDRYPDNARNHGSISAILDCPDNAHYPIHMLYFFIHKDTILLNESNSYGLQ